jgi:hypothetical protein
MPRRKGGTPGSRPTKAEVLQKQTRVLQARLAGMTWAQSAKVAGYANASNAQKAALQLLEDQASTTAESYRHLTSMRLERLLATVWSAALGGDGAAWDRARQVAMDLAKLHGSIAPTRLEITDEMDREIAALAATLGSDETWDITTLPGGETHAALEGADDDD